MHGKIAGSPIETDRSGHIRFREALRVLALSKLVVVESSVGEMRIRLGERALQLWARGHVPIGLGGLVVSTHSLAGSPPMRTRI